MEWLHYVSYFFGGASAPSSSCCLGFAAAIVGIFYLVKYRRLRIHIGAGRLRFSPDGGDGMMQPPWG